MYNDDLWDWIKLIGSTLLVGGMLVAGCTSSNRAKVPEMVQGEYDTNYDTGAHIVLEVDRKVVPVSSSMQIGLEAPKGYKIIDFDYDRWNCFDFYDYVYQNDTQVYVSDPNDLGSSTTLEEQKDSFLPGEHVIASVVKKFALFGQEDITFALNAPSGYKVLDYDYDKTSALEFENITYANEVEVTCSDINEFGKPVEPVPSVSHENGFYDIGEHKIVKIIKQANPWWGKDEMKQIVAPKGYKIVDYDYDKTDYSEYETITYENIVPVSVSDVNKFGLPTVEIEANQEGIGEYEPYTHVLVRIDRNMHFGFGDNGTKQLLTPDGYELLDYDYDVNDDFEFETYVYINNKRIYLEDTTNFGTVIEQDEVKKKTLVP